MKCESKPFIRIERKYTINEIELKKSLGLQGIINSINLYSGTLPEESMNQMKADWKVWEILTEEVTPHDFATQSSKAGEFNNNFTIRKSSSKSCRHKVEVQAGSHFYCKDCGKHLGTQVGKTS